MKFVVGLGNPGGKYRNTPHNVGFEVVDRLGRSAGVSDLGGGPRRKFKAEYLELARAAEKVLLIKPQTYMNLSGEAVQGMLGYFRGSREDLLVVHDDIDLPIGRLRFRARGSSGGHRGIASIIRSVGGPDFDRLKIGVSPDPPSGDEGRLEESDEALARRRRDAADYVTTPFSSRARASMDQVLDRAVRAVELWIEEGLEASAQEFN